MGAKESAEQVARDIRCRTRKQYSAEDKIRIVLEGFRGEESIAALCRREGITDTFLDFRVGCPSLMEEVRHKDGKKHRYWSVVEKVRVASDRTVQRQVLHFGEINDSEYADWALRDLFYRAHEHLASAIERRSVNQNKTCCFLSVVSVREHFATLHQTHITFLQYCFIITDRKIHDPVNDEIVLIRSL